MSVAICMVHFSDMNNKMLFTTVSGNPHAMEKACEKFIKYYINYSNQSFRDFCQGITFFPTSDTAEDEIVKHGCPLLQKVKIWQILYVLHFDPTPPLGTCEVSEV